MRLILHAGTHKTGTKSIQKVLAENQAWLRDRGLIYPDGAPHFRNSKYPQHRFAHAFTGTNPVAMRKAKDMITELYKSACASDTILVSAEPVYRHIAHYDGWDRYTGAEYWAHRLQYLKMLHSGLAGFDVEVLLFFRSRESFAESLYGEVIRKRHWRGPFDEFLQAFNPLFDYDRQIDAFRRVFGCVRVEDYDRARRDGLMASFFNAIGFEMPPHAEGVWVNRSAYANCLWPSAEARTEFLAKYDRSPRQGWGLFRLGAFTCPKARNV